MAETAIIGPGRAGRTLHARFEAAGLPCRLVRDPAEAAGAATVLLAVPDDAQAVVAAAVPGEPWLGTLSGATPLARLGDGPRRFVLHPAQTMSRAGGAAQLDGVTAFVTGASAEALVVATELAHSLSLRPVSIPEEVRPLPHLACVIASNYLVAIEATAVALLAEAGVVTEDAVEALRPLAELTLQRALGPGGSLAPTGPVARGDAQTIRLHLEALEARAPDLLPLYRTLGEALLPLVPVDAAARARDALGSTPAEG